MKHVVYTVLAVWFVVVVVLGARGAYATPTQSPPLPILLGVMTPLLVFALAYATSQAFRQFVRSADLVFLTAVQGWRAGGLVFLAFSAYGLLPKLFAWPAGLGDIAIGVTAPWVLLALLRDPEFSRSRKFVVWNLLGILDLVVAIGTGAMSSGLLANIAGPVTTAPMAQLPLVLIPAYLVPIFVMLHVSALVSVRAKQESRREASANGATRLPTTLSAAM